MCPSASESVLPGAAAPGGPRGFTLLEVMVALAAGAILLWGLTRFYKDSSHAYELQAQVAERDQNAHFTIRWLTEALQQAGASLPDSGYPVITTSGNPATSITLGSNPSGGICFVSSPGPANLAKAPVGDTDLFIKATHVLVDYADPARATVKRPIASRKKGAAGALDTLMLSANLPYALGVGDVIYAYKEDAYALSGSDLAMSGMTLAENIDTLRFNFYDGAGNSTSNWASMRSALIQVTARTALPDHKLPGDGYRRISLTMNVFLRSRV